MTLKGLTAGKTYKLKFSVVSRFQNMLYGKKQKVGNAEK